MTLNYIEVGSGRPLVILHGLLGSARNWGGIAQALGDKRRVLAVDMPNHGASPWSEIMDYPFMAREIGKFLDAIVGEPVDLLGHSMGGKAAMTLALTRPELVSRLVVADIAPVRYGHTFAPYIKAMRAAPVGTATRRGEVEEALRAIITDPGVRAFLMQNLEGQPGSYRWRANLAVLGASMDEILDFPHFPDGTHFGGPTLFLHGDLSDYVRPAHQDIIAALFPDHRLESLAGAGHWVHADRPADFVRAVGEFIG
jgi:esterase